MYITISTSLHTYLYLYVYNMGMVSHGKILSLLRNKETNLLYPGSRKCQLYLINCPSCESELMERSANFYVFYEPFIRADILDFAIAIT